MTALYLICFLTGILFGVRLLFFGAERRRPKEGTTPLRRSEPAVVAFVAMFGLAGYVFTHSGVFAVGETVGYSAIIALLWAFVVTRIAIATARIVPEVNPDDPRFMLQGCVAVVTREIPADANGEISFDDAGTARTLLARDIASGGIAAGDEVCIERVEDGVAFVERWSLVEQRL